MLSKSASDLRSSGCDVCRVARVPCVRRMAPSRMRAPRRPSLRRAYADKVRETYNFPFGKGKISVPGNAAAAGDDFLEPSAFLDAQYCGHCHQEAYHQWRQALHSNSFRTPFYRTSVNILLRTKGIEFARHCDSCHNPIAVLAGAMNPNSPIDRLFRSRWPDLHHLPFDSERGVKGWEWRICHGRPFSAGG